MKQGLFPMLVVGLVLLVAGAGTWAAIDLMALSPSRALEAQILEVEDQVVAFRSRSAALRGELTSLPAVPGDTHSPVDSGVPLSESIVPLFENNDGQVLSAETLAPRRNSDAQSPIRIRARFSEDGLIFMLNQLSSERPDAVIGDLSVQSLPLPPEARPLDVTITLSGQR